MSSPTSFTPPPVNTVCPGCNSTAKPVTLLCTGCRNIKYCSPKCQKVHREAHKQKCILYMDKNVNPRTLTPDPVLLGQIAHLQKHSPLPIISIGCGTGRFEYILKTKGKYEVIPVDPAPESYESYPTDSKDYLIPQYAYAKDVPEKYHHACHVLIMWPNPDPSEDTTSGVDEGDRIEPENIPEAYDIEAIRILRPITVTLLYERRIPSTKSEKELQAKMPDIYSGSSGSNALRKWAQPSNMESYTRVAQWHHKVKNLYPPTSQGNMDFFIESFIETDTFPTLSGLLKELQANEEYDKKWIIRKTTRVICNINFN